MELWRKIYEFIYMPLLLPLPVHMCVKENDFFCEIIFFRKEWKIISIAAADPFWGSITHIVS